MTATDARLSALADGCRCLVAIISSARCADRGPCHATTPRCGWCLAAPAEPCAKLARHLPCRRVAA